MPSAPPNSELVSEIPAAAPARSGGAAPTMMSVASVNTGARPRAKTTEPLTTVASPSSPLTWASNTKPAAASTSPAAITEAGRLRRTNSGVSSEPTMKPAADGSVQRPASKGDNPSTSWRYWAMNTADPEVHEEARTCWLPARR